MMRMVEALKRDPAGAVQSAGAAPSAYERRFATSIGGGVSAFAFWKGRVAMYAILRAMGVGPGDEVVVPGFTCVAVPNAVRLTGATPVYADIESGGLNLDPASVERRLTARTKAILVQHSFGIPAALDELMNLAQVHKLRVIEDCAHTMSGEHRGRRLGTIGDAAFYSSQWSKPYTTGLGGMAVTQDEELVERLRAVQDSFIEPPLAARLRLDVQYQLYARLFTSRRYWLAQDVLHAVASLGLFVGSSSEDELTGHEPIDHTWRMARMQQEQGQRLVGTVGPRARYADALAGRYQDRLAGEGWVTPVRPTGAALLRYPMLVANKAELLAASRHERVELGSWFESPLHPLALDVHHHYGYVPGQCPNAERSARLIVNLPLHLGISFDEAERVAQFFVQHARPPE